MTAIWMILTVCVTEQGVFCRWNLVHLDY